MTWAKGTASGHPAAQAFQLLLVRQDYRGGNHIAVVHEPLGRQAEGSRLPAPGSRLPAPGSRLPAEFFYCIQRRAANR
ncbi:hypothetical protein GCM10020000_47490 [Streptomyces olivoverticillatus]